MRRLILILILLSCATAEAKYTSEETIVDYSDTSVPILNEELRRLRKNYEDTHSVPAGGTASQALVKLSATDYDVAWSTITTITPTGMITQFAGSVAPTGWLLCDGSEVSQTTYSALFAICGTTYNTGGEGAGNFRLPNLKGKVAVGYNAAEAEFDALGETGGSKVPALLDHTHTGAVDGTNVQIYSGGTARKGAIDTSQTTGSTSSGSQTAGNLQPYITLNYIIKY